MQRVTLTASPGASCPNYRITCDLLGDVRHRLVVTERVKIVFIKPCSPRGIEPVNRSALSKIYLYCADSHFQQICQQSLRPLDGLRVTEINNRILERQSSAFIADHITFIDRLLIYFVLAG